MRIYEKHYTLTQLDTSTGEVYSLGFPQEAIIKKVTVQQTVGTDVSFDVTFYNADPTSLTADEKVKHIVVPGQSALAGDAVAVLGGDYVFLNMEGKISDRSQSLYMELTATASTDNTWEVAVGGTPASS